MIVSVADEGLGISPADKETLFQTFHRIQRQETISIRGIGLGLYIVKEWTEAMGGKVWIESELNKGTTFFVALPTRLAGKTSPYILGIRRAKQMVKVLIVDDEEPILSLLSAILSSMPEYSSRTSPGRPGSDRYSKGGKARYHAAGQPDAGDERS